MSVKFLLILAFVFVLTCRPAPADEAGGVVVLFDQSGSIRNTPSEERLKVVLLAKTSAMAGEQKVTAEAAAQAEAEAEGAEAKAEAEAKSTFAVIMMLMILVLGGAAAWVLFRRVRAREVAKNVSGTDWLTDRERRFSLRVAAPPGAMIIHWTNRDGAQFLGMAINISLHGVLFEAPRFDAESIDRVVCSRLNIDLKVTKSAILRSDVDGAVAVLEEFEDNVDSKMRWIELLTRIDEE